MHQLRTNVIREREDFKRHYSVRSINCPSTTENVVTLFALKCGEERYFETSKWEYYKKLVGLMILGL
jgi:hypothetical protein